MTDPVRREGGNAMVGSRHGRSPVLPSVMIAGGIVLVFALAYFGLFGRGPDLQGVFGSLVKKGELVSLMRVEFQKANESEKSAVLADTDEDSIAYADRSRAASDEVERARAELGKLIATNGTEKEKTLFDQFSASFTRVREIDREVLGLAVQNTNLKALQLAFGPSEEALGRFEASLNAAMASESPAERREEAVSVRFACEALVSVWKIQSLLAPHILESRDDRMDELEAKMKGLNARAVESLARVADLLPPGAGPALDEARAAYGNFMEIHERVLRLSRENTNVRSLALSLGKKRLAAAECDDLLNALQHEIRNTTFKATR